MTNVTKFKTFILLNASYEEILNDLIKFNPEFDCELFKCINKFILAYHYAEENREAVISDKVVSYLIKKYGLIDETKRVIQILN